VQSFLHGENNKENQNKPKKNQEADTTDQIIWKKKTKAFVNLTVRTIQA
jgi:hypothetical protein